jgi:PIN domain nuclease of toxin-antitoxin system
MATGDPRLKRIDQTRLLGADSQLLVSSVVAFELSDLQKRGRVAMSEPLDFLQRYLEFEIVSFPADCWRLAAKLPPIHRDPVDRMLVAHALAEGFTLATADANIRRYPVPFI